MFETFHLHKLPTFEDLMDASPPLEGVTGGRVGGVIVDRTADTLVPIVRTTTRYNNPPRLFQPIHHDLVKKIGKPFNNGLVEVYTDAYKTMGYHSDQAQDLTDDSYIAVVSIYKEPDLGGIRQLHIKKKAGADCASDCAVIPMTHGSVILFDLTTNRQWNHKIVLSEPKGNVWFGITFRLSKTFVKDGVLVGIDKPLRILYKDDNDEHDIYKLRRQENRQTNFVWPSLDVSLSPSDVLMPIV